MLLLKDNSVLHSGLVPEMYYAIGVAAALKMQLFKINCVVTSLLDGKHNAGSLHPLGLAADLRTLGLTPDEAKQWLDAIKAELEPIGFDCGFESGVGATPATTGQHIHVEFQLKPGESFWHYLNPA